MFVVFGVLLLFEMLLSVCVVCVNLFVVMFEVDVIKMMNDGDLDVCVMVVYVVLMFVMFLCEF